MNQLVNRRRSTIQRIPLAGGDHSDNPTQDTAPPGLPALPGAPGPRTQPGPVRPPTTPAAAGPVAARGIPAPPSRVRTLQDPSSGVDLQPLEDALKDPFNAVRMFGELSRPIPLAGIVGGGMAVLIAGGQNIFAIAKEGVTFTLLLMAARSGINTANNIVGQLAYCDQWIQNAATGSIELAPADAVTSPAMLGMKPLQGVMDSFSSDWTSSSLPARPSTPPERPPPSPWPGGTDEEPI